jgi:hypothetical protein
VARRHPCLPLLLERPRSCVPKPLFETIFVAAVLNMSIVAGALSFSTRPIPISESAAIQARIWDTAHERGAGGRHPEWLVRSNCGRLLVPALIAGVSRLGVSWDRAFSLVRLATIVAAYLVFFYYLRGWFDPTIAMAGFLFMCATMPLTFSNWHELPTDFPELLFFTLAYWVLRENRVGWLVPLVAVATLNRETAVFIPVLAFLANLHRGIWRAVLLGMALGVTWAVPYCALRWWTGVPLVGSYGSTWSHNQAGLVRLLENWNPFNHYLYYLWLLGPLWLAPILGYRNLPLMLRRAMWLVPVSAPVYLVFGGYLNEPRPLMHFYALFIPAGLYALFGVPTSPDGLRVQRETPDERT